MKKKCELKHLSNILETKSKREFISSGERIYTDIFFVYG